MEIKNINHVGIRVDDLEKAVSFFVDAMGMRVVSRQEVGDLKLAFVELKGMEIELYAGAAGDIPDRGPIDHLCFEVGTIEGAEAHIAKFAPGIDFGEINERPGTGKRWAIFLGPGGARIQLMQFLNR